MAKKAISIFGPKVVFTFRLPKSMTDEIRQLTKLTGWTVEHLALYAFAQVLSEQDEIIADAKGVEKKMRVFLKEALASRKPGKLLVMKKQGKTKPKSRTVVPSEGSQPSSPAVSSTPRCPVHGSYGCYCNPSTGGRAPYPGTPCTIHNSYGCNCTL